MSTIDISEKQKIQFVVEIEGTDISNLKPRLVLHEGSMLVAFKGKTEHISGNSVNLIFDIPPLNGIIKSESVDADVEMFIENRFYIPYSTTFSIEKPVSITVTESIKHEPKHDNGMKIKSVHVIKEKHDNKVRADVSKKLIIENLLEDLNSKKINSGKFKKTLIAEIKKLKLDKEYNKIIQSIQEENDDDRMLEKLDIFLDKLEKSGVKII
jgi:hypothetical protein